MLARPETFEAINAGFNRVFRPGRLSIGLVVPLTRYPDSPVPDLSRHLKPLLRADRLGFSALWLRDVPFNVTAFGDAGQVFDPFVYLGLLAGQTERIALGVSSIILPLRHPAHVAKAAASVDMLSDGRLILGVASGDRPQEYPALGVDFDTRGALFREHFDYIRRLGLEGSAEMEMLPKPTGSKLPLLITGGSQQTPGWGAEHADGWMTYPRSLPHQAQAVAQWRGLVPQGDKPVMQPLYLDLVKDEDPPRPIHLGFRCGIGYLRDYMIQLQQIGVNHVALNLRFNGADIEDTMKRLADELLPEFD